MVFVYAFNIQTFMRMKLPAVESPDARVSPVRNLIEGGRYIWGYQAVLGLMIIAVLGNGLPMAGQQTLLPIYAKKVFDVGPGGLGLMFTFSGIGGLIGSSSVVLLGQVKHKAKLNIMAGVGMGAAALLLTLSPVYALTLPIIAIHGFSSSLFLTLGNALLLEISSINMRGRVMGVRGMALLANLPGSMFTGAMAGMFGARGAGGIVGISTIAMMLGVAALIPQMLRVDSKTKEEISRDSKDGVVPAEPARAG
jgi:MFS family permease